MDTKTTTPFFNRTDTLSKLQQDITAPPNAKAMTGAEQEKANSNTWYAPLPHSAHGILRCVFDMTV